MIRESVKSTLLKEATRDDSTLWKSSLNNTDSSTFRHDTGPGSVDQPLNSLYDPLDDLYISGSAPRHWPSLPPSVAPSIDPFILSRQELDTLAATIRENLIGTQNPVLNKAAAYFFQPTVDGGKKIRPMMVVLLSRALADSAAASLPGSAPHPAVLPSSLFTRPLPGQRPDLPQAQRRLGEIAELIHHASLFHDDVIDEADTRRGVPAVHQVFGNKVAILAGDYLLARASIALARLRHAEVIENMATIIEHLVRGEVMQMHNGKATSESSTHGGGSAVTKVRSIHERRLVFYLQKNFYKTASLMAFSCKSTALLGGYSDEMVKASYRYGKHVGMAFQLVDDVLDYQGTLSELGKAPLSDIKAGLATAPVLFAAEEYPDLEPMIERKFKLEGDVDRAVALVSASAGIERTKELARLHADRAVDSVLELHASEARDALIHLAHKVVARTQ